PAAARSTGPGPRTPRPAAQGATVTPASGSSVAATARASFSTSFGRPPITHSVGVFTISKYAFSPGRSAATTSSADAAITPDTHSTGFSAGAVPCDRAAASGGGGAGVEQRRAPVREGTS